jgi:hypothetical protein
MRGRSERSIYGRFRSYALTGKGALFEKIKGRLLSGGAVYSVQFS